MPETAVLPPPGSPPAGVQPPPAQVPPPLAPPPAAPAQLKAADLVKRLSEIPPDQKPTDGIQAPDEFRVKLNLDDIKDPVTRQYFEQKERDANRGINEKFMRLAEERKKLEAQTVQPWTPERVNGLLTDQGFLQSANAVLAARPKDLPSTWEGTPEQWSALTQQEKAAFQAVEQKANQANQKIDQLIAQQSQLLNAQEHQAVRTRFPDYDTEQVERVMREVVENKVSSEQLKEWVWKATNFERYIENAYQFGLRDRQGNLQQKIEGATPAPATLTVSSSEDKPKMLEGEKPGVFFRRLADWNLSRVKR